MFIFFPSSSIFYLNSVSLFPFILWKSLSDTAADWGLVGGGRAGVLLLEKI
jgi:hypothetical protein